MKKQNLSDSLLRWALEQNIAKQKTQITANEELAQNIGFDSQQMESKQRKTIRRNQTKLAIRYSFRVAVLLVCVSILTFSVSLVMVDGFRFEILHWIEQTGLISIKWSNPTQEKLEVNGFRLHYLPDHYLLEQTTDTLLRFGDGRDGFLMIKIDTMQTQAMVDSNAAYERVTITDGLDGFYKSKDGQGTLIFYESEKYIQLTGTLSQTELLRIANGLENLETP